MIVRVRWRDGRATSADVMWARTVSGTVAAAPVHLAMKHLREWEDLVLGRFAEEEARRIRRDAEARGHSVELLTSHDYGAAYVESAVGCSPLVDEQLRVTLLPSFHREGAFTASRTPTGWEFELRIARESIWHTRFSEVPFAHWSDVRRAPGVEVIRETTLRDPATDVARMLSTPSAPATDPRMAGIDGMTIQVASRLAGATFDEDAWSPPRGTRVREATDLTLDLARDASPEWCRDLSFYLSR